MKPFRELYAIFQVFSWIKWLQGGTKLDGVVSDKNPYARDHPLSYLPSAHLLCSPIEGDSKCSLVLQKENPEQSYSSRVPGAQDFLDPLRRVAEG